MDVTVWINLATMASGFIIAAGGLFLTKRKNMEEGLVSLHSSANIDRTWLRDEVTRLREENKEFRLEIIRLRALCQINNVDPDKESPR